MCFSGCTSKKPTGNIEIRKIDGEKFHYVDIDIAGDVSEFDINQLFDSCKIVILDNSTDAFINKVSRIGITDNYLALVPMGLNGQLKLFDINGKFLRLIGNIGRGPGEYIALNGLDFSGEFNHILCEPALVNSFYLYDINSSLVKQIPRRLLGTTHAYFQINQKEIIDIGYASLSSQNAPSDSISIIIQDFDGNILYEKNPSISAFQTRIGGTSIPLKVYPYQNEIRIHAGQDTLYSFNPKTKELSVYAVFKSSLNGYDFSHMNELKAKDQYDKISNSLQGKIHIEVIFETKDYIYLKAYKRSSAIGHFGDGTTVTSDITEEAGNYVFSKKSNTIEQVQLIDSFCGLNLNSKTNTSLFGGMPLLAVNNNVCVSLIQSIHLKSEIQKILQDQITPDYIKTKLRGIDELIDPEESNAVLFMYYLKNK